MRLKMVAGSWWLVAGGWWLVAGGWWLVAGGWWLVWLLRSQLLLTHWIIEQKLEI
jgi:hypothetical protein